MSNCELVLETTGAEKTRELGARLAAWLNHGDVLALIGDLGAGKTAFTQGVAAGLGVHASVTSPTFVLINQYPTATGGALQHVDCYRLSNAPVEMWDLGLVDLFAGDDIVVIEWADRVGNLLPAEYVEVRFEYLDPERRRLTFVPHGARGVDLVCRLKQAQAATVTA